MPGQMFTIMIDGKEYSSGVSDDVMCFLLHHLPTEFPQAKISWADDASYGAETLAHFEEVA